MQHRTGQPGRAAQIWMAGLLLVLAAPLLALTALAGDPFGGMRVSAWALLIAVPPVLIGNAVIWRRHRPWLALSGVVLATGLLVIGGDAFLVEPHWLEITTIERPAAQLTKPLRIALLADIQTDHIGAFERQVIGAVVAGQPDLILFAGDSIQSDPDRYRAELDALATLLSQERLTAPLGAFAVRGNVDQPGKWQHGFAATGVQVVEAAIRFDLGPVVLTCLSLADSFSPATTVAAASKFHIVCGHSPDYSLGNINGDLLLAGHTHGGQVRLPFLGPLITFSLVPRKWAHGITEITPDKHLIVSRGIGMERGRAPRIRFLCRPQLIFIDLEPPASPAIGNLPRKNPHNGLIGLDDGRQVNL